MEQTTKYCLPTIFYFCTNSNFAGRFPFLLLSPPLLLLLLEVLFTITTLSVVESTAEPPPLPPTDCVPLKLITKNRKFSQPCVPPHNTSSVIVDRFDDPTLFQRSRPIAKCPCGDAYTKEFYGGVPRNYGTISTATTGPVTETKYEMEVNIRSLCSGDLTNLCVCSPVNGGECYHLEVSGGNGSGNSSASTSGNRAAEVASVAGEAVALSYCGNVASGCQMHFAFIPHDPAKLDDQTIASFQLVGDRGTVISADRFFSKTNCNGFCPVDAASAHPKIAAISCNGCPAIRRSFYCWGPTQPYHGKVKADTIIQQQQSESAAAGSGEPSAAAAPDTALIKIVV